MEISAALILMLAGVVTILEGKQKDPELVALGLILIGLGLIYEKLARK